MKIERRKFLSTLQSIVCATSRHEILEQSNCFIFTEDSIMAFNGEVYARIAFKSSWKFAINANDLIKLLSKIPDKEIKLELKDNQLIVIGKKKRAGLTIENEILLPVEEIPFPEKKMTKIRDNTLENLAIASKICIGGNEDYRISHVYLTPTKIQATDRFRVLCIDFSAGYGPILIPASAILSLPDTKFDKIKIENGWFFVANKDIFVGICCSLDPYYEENIISDAFKMEDSSKIQLPKEMESAIERALIMAEDDASKLANISLTKKSIIIKTQKDSGWYEEKQPARYKGADMKIVVGLSLFKDLLSKTHKALINKNKMKMKKDNIEFVIPLEN